MQQALLFLKKPSLKKSLALVMVLIKITLLIFLVLSRYGLACKYGIIFENQHIIGCRIAFSDTWHNNCQLGNAKTYS